MPFSLAPLVPAGLSLVAQAGEGMAGAGGYVVVGLITALGTAVIQPWLKERGTAARLEEQTRKAEALEARVAALETSLGERDRRLADKDAAELRLIAKLTEATDRSLRLSAVMLAHSGRIRPIEGTPTFLIDDHAPDHDGPAVLLIEDADEARVPMTTMLELAHCRVTAVATFGEGMEALEEKPDVVVLDLMLPGGDGLGILKAVRDRGLPSRVIVTTGRPPHLLGAVAALDPVAILSKPVDINELVRLIRDGAAAVSGGASP